MFESVDDLIPLHVSHQAPYEALLARGRCAVLLCGGLNARGQAKDDVPRGARTLPGDHESVSPRAPGSETSSLIHLFDLIAALECLLDDCIQQQLDFRCGANEFNSLVYFEAEYNYSVTLMII